MFDYTDYSDYTTGLTYTDLTCLTGFTISNNNYTTTQMSSNWYMPVEDILTRRKLREFCSNNEITEEVFIDLEERIPLGADLLTELVKINKIDDIYVKTLLRNKKMKTL